MGRATNCSAARAAAVFVAMAVIGCAKPDAEVVVYCALDREFAEPILRQFERETGIIVRAKFDTESTKAVGLAELLLRERRQPRCDVFWNNEALHTIRLGKANVLMPYRSPIGLQYPAQFRSADGLWYGFAARVRVLLVNTQLVAQEDQPACLEDLTQPQWRGRVGMAKPLFGTTATHVACWFAAMGPERAKDFLRRLKANDMQIFGGNKQVAVAVGGGSLAIGLTDTDDALAEMRSHRPVRIVCLDQNSDGLGALMIPNTVALIRGGLNPQSGCKLIDYLLSGPVEEMLARSASGQIPLNPAVAFLPATGIPEKPKLMDVAFDRAADEWEAATGFVKELFTVP